MVANTCQLGVNIEKNKQHTSVGATFLSRYITGLDHTRNLCEAALLLFKRI